MTTQRELNNRIAKKISESKMKTEKELKEENTLQFREVTKEFKKGFEHGKKDGFEQRNAEVKQVIKKWFPNLKKEKDRALFLKLKEELLQKLGLDRK